MKKENLFWGLLLIAMGVILIISKLGFGPQINLFTLFLTILFGAGMVSSIIHIEFTGFWFCLAFLAILYAEPLHIQAITPWTVLIAAGLLSVGCSMLYRPARKNIGSHRPYGEGDKDFKVYNEPDGNEFNFSSSFCGSIKYVNSDNFEVGNIDCRFAGMKIYFDNAMIQKGSATLNIDLSFSGLELYIPKNWRIENNLHASLGGVEEKNKYAQADGPVLILNGNINLGGVTIIYV